MAYPGEPAYVVISITDTGFSRGMNSVGEVNFVAHAFGEESDPAFASVPVTVYVGDFSLIFMPSISK
jgi:hypothetical protein